MVRKKDGGMGNLLLIDQIDWFYYHFKSMEYIASTTMVTIYLPF